MLSFIRRKKGSTSVFMLIVLASMIGLTMTYIYSAQKKAAVGFANGVLILSARSVMSEYDRELKNRYGIFAFRGDESEIEYKMKYYANYTFDVNDSVNMTQAEADIGNGKLTNIDVFEKEIIEYSKFALTKGILKELKDGDTLGDGSSVEGGTRILRNKGVIDELPSKGATAGGLTLYQIQAVVAGWNQVFTSGGKNVLMNYYIMQHFGNGQKPLLEHRKKAFFKNEVEYILSGKLSDKENLQAFRLELIVLRNIVNLLHIYVDPVKRSQLIAASAAAGGGIGATVAQVILAEAWAFAESENDVRLLENGKKVPMYKTPDTWAVDLQSIISNQSGEYIDTNSDVGLTYQGYLQVFLFFKNRDVKLLRMMDLMQINLQGSHDESFLMKEQNVSFQFKGRVNGRQHGFDSQY